MRLRLLPEIDDKMKIMMMMMMMMMTTTTLGEVNVR